MPNDLDLRFGPGTSPSGFTPAGVAAFDDLRPAAVVRELIQNSLDAATEAGRDQAVVRFRLFERDLDDVPGLPSYEDAFERAADFHQHSGELPAKAQDVVDAIRHVLEWETCDLLSVSDNGIGLDTTRMSALLSDGVSAKPQGSSGTYGNGHSVAIPASDLRYVLYGGVTADSGRIAAGHAVIASHPAHPGESYLRSGDGFLVRGFGGGHDGNVFRFGDATEIPKIVADELDAIEADFGQGTAVILPAFNFFREDCGRLRHLIFEAAASNFFVAIEGGRLRVEFEDEADHGERSVLDATALRRILEGIRDKKRSRAFLSGAKAYEAHHTLVAGAKDHVATSEGRVEVRLRLGAERTRIDLCRNGMWITYDKGSGGIPGFYYKFADRVPFHALLLLDRSDGGNLYELIRRAEGPLHDSIRAKDLPDHDRKRLRDALAEVRAWLRAQVPEPGAASFKVDDFLAIDFGEDSAAGGGTTSAASQGSPSILRSRTPTWRSRPQGSGRGRRRGQGGNHKPNRGRSGKQAVLKSAYQAVCVPTGYGRRRVVVTCVEAAPDAILRLRVNENVDATCERLWYEVTPAILRDVRMNGGPAPDSDLVLADGNVVGVRLGHLDRGESVELEARVSVPKVFGHWNGDVEPSLSVEVVEEWETGAKEAAVVADHPPPSARGDAR